MAIRIVRNNNGNCVTFVGSSQPAYWNACLSGEVNDEDNTRVNVVNDVRTTDSDNPIYEFFAVPYTEFQDADGNSFADAAEAAAYITEKANVIGGAIEFDAITAVDFSRDNTLTSIVTSLGDSFAVNGIKAVAETDGTVSIAENTPTGVNLYEKIRKQNITIEGQSQAFTLSAVVNALNAFFTVTPVGAGADDTFDSFVLSPIIPAVTGFGDVDIVGGVATKGSNTNSQFNDGFFTDSQPISQPGEYFYFNNTGYDFDRKFIIGLLETSKFTNAATLESITTSGGLLDLSVRLAPGAAYENSDYGVVIENGFYEKPRNSVVFRAGINSDGRLIIDHQTNGEWATIVRSAFPITDGEEYMLVCMMNKENAQVATSTVRSYQLSSSIVLNYRYIESPDGSFYYPLFSDRGQADYVSQNANTIFGGSYVNDTDANDEGRYSHSHVFIDEQSNTTWYMPDNYAFEAVGSAPTNTLDITYTEIPTAADSNYVPPAFSGSDQQWPENYSVNLQVTPAGATWVTTVSGLPPNLSFDGSSLITGTTQYVPADETHTITVTRTNAYGSSTGTFDITIQDNASLGDLADFTELDGNFVQPNRALLTHDFVMKYNYTLSPGEELTFTISASSGISGLGSSPPTIGILSATGNTAYNNYPSANVALGSTGYDFAPASMWDLRFRPSSSFFSIMVGFSDNTALGGTVNENVGPVLKLKYDLSDNYIRLYRGSSLLRTSASTFTGAQTITLVGFDDQSESDLFVPSDLTIINSSYGSTQPPSGFENPLLEGAMATATLMGEAPDEDAAAQLTADLKINHRYIFPQTWVENNVLPYTASDASNKAFIGVSTVGADFTDVGETDFDAYFKIQGTSSTTSYQSRINTGSGGTSTETSVTINSLTDSFYDYALEWDGTDLHVIACNVGDINTQPGISVGGTFNRTKTLSSYGRSGDLPVVIGVDEGAQVNLTTSGLTQIRIPFGINDILVAENSNGTGEFSIQPAAAAYDAHSGGHVPSGYGFAYAGVTTLNAGTTYRFIYHPSMETGDLIEFRLASDGTTVYTTGVTTFGSGDPDFTSAYKGIEFAVPADAPPLTLYYYNSFSSAYDSGRAISISGSTYSVGVTGITQEGPAANQTGDNLFDVNDYGWISVDEQLGAGERLLLTTAFLADLVDAMPDGSSIKIGLKDTGWAATTADTNFEGALRFVIERNSSTDVDLRAWSGASSTTLITTTVAGITTNNIAAFFDLTSSGNNIRFGIRTDTVVNTDSITTTAYGDWSTNFKVQTGSQGYGLTSVDVMFLGRDLTAGTAMDLTDVTWTRLSEISVPTPAATLTTNWTKALDFSGSAERAEQVDSGALYNPLRMAGISTNVAANATAGYTSDDVDARPWAIACVFNSDGNASNQHIWNMGEGTSSTHDNIYLRQDASGNLYFGWGRDADGVNECAFGSITAGTWYGIYIASTGERVGGTYTAADIADCFDIRIVDLSTGAAGSNLSTSTTWTAGSFGGRMNRQFTGDLTIGGRGSNRNWHGKVASTVVTTLRRNVAMPTDAEISAIVRDPLQWLTDYKVGNSYRQPSNSTDTSNFQTGDASSSYSTQVWLMGDGTSDAYSQIRNQVYAATQNQTPLNMISMVSNDIQTVNISGLT